MELNYKELGHGPPIIILHGLFGMLDNWITVGKKLAEEYSVYLIDQRNHGKSPRNPETNYPLMAEDLRHFMEAHWIHKAHVIGHSMGGKTAMQFALEYPDMIDKLIVVDIGPWKNRSRHDLIFDTLLSVNLEAVQSRKDAEAILGEKISDEGVKQFLLKNLSRNKESGYQWKMNLPALHENFPAILAPVHSDHPFEGSSLFIRGEKSDYIPNEDIPKIGPLFPEAEVTTIENAGHWVHADAPKELLEEVKAFLKG